MKGISSLSRITGQEHNDISRFLLSIIIDIPLPGRLSAPQLLRSIRGLVDVLYLAHYPIQTDKTLALFHTALEQFHNNKQILIDVGVRNDFHFPKLHFLNHYVEKAEFLGTFDNTNTEHTERLHINLAKDAYRATNSKDEYPQMTMWLERKEKVLRHDCYLRWLCAGKPKISPIEWTPPGLSYRRSLHMAKYPTVRSLRLPVVDKRYSVPFFRAALARFVVQLHDPTISGPQLEAAALDIDTDFAFSIAVSIISSNIRTSILSRMYTAQQIRFMYNPHVKIVVIVLYQGDLIQL